MSSEQTTPFQLRPNKALDRELFLSLLVWLASKLSLKRHHYIGLGGPFLDDFRLVHARIGITKMTCIESESLIHNRQLFNRPFSSIECVHSTIEDYLDSSDLELPVIIWFDYTAPQNLKSQIERFARTIGIVQKGSILRITLNANPSSLGNPDPYEISVEVDGEVTEDRRQKPTVQEWRLERFKERVGSLFPNDINAEYMTNKRFGLSLLKTLQIAVEKELLSHQDRRVAWAFSTHYADGQAMVTATLVVCNPENDETDDLLRDWEFNTLIDEPHKLNLPVLSTYERLTMESRINEPTLLSHDLPKTELGEDPIDVFKKFYRIYPHFSRIEL